MQVRSRAMSLMLPVAAMLVASCANDAVAPGVGADGPQSMMASESLPAAPAPGDALAASATSIEFAWTDNSTNETRFEVRRRVDTGDGSGWSAYSPLATTAADEQSYIDGGLVQGHKYRYAILACNDAGCSKGSASAVATIPTRIPVQALDVVATAVSATSVEITWTDRSSNESRFEVQRRERSTGPLGTWGAWGVTASVERNATSYIDATVASGPYQYMVSACNVVGCSRASRSLVAIVSTPPRNVLMVNHAAAGANNGTSWADAYTDLQAALAAATSGQEIWVAAGTYRPSATGDATVSFALEDGVEVYGGFAGVEGARAQRDWRRNVTVLTGDLTADFNNSHNVVRGNDIGATAVLDGFTITGGVPVDLAEIGGGIFLTSASPTLTNLTISGNQGTAIFNSHYSSPLMTNMTISDNFGSLGGGIFNNEYSSPMLIDVKISGNRGTWGGGMYNGYASSPTLINVTISNNYTQSVANGLHLGGGGMYNNGASTPTLINVKILYNYALNGRGGGMHNTESSVPRLINVTIRGNEGSGIWNTGSAAPVISNSIIWQNGGDPAGSQEVENDNGSATIDHSIVRGGYTGTGNLNQDPLFTYTVGSRDPDAWDVTPLPGSPAIDAGDNAVVPTGVTTDLAGSARIVNGTVDMGAYEVQ